jgi:ABC-type branched-subunit amino acid transport system substrate-binding protein
MSYLLVLLIFIASCSAWEPHYDTIAPPTNYQRGEDAMRHGDLALAARLFDVYLSETADPTFRPRAFYQSARAHYGLGQYRKTLAVLDEMEGEFPKEKWPQTATLRGDAEYALGNRTSGFLSWETAWQRGTNFDRAVLRDRMGRAVGELSSEELRELQRLVTVDEVRDMLKTPLFPSELARESTRGGLPAMRPAPESAQTASAGAYGPRGDAIGEDGRSFDSQPEADFEAGPSGEPYDALAQPSGPGLGALLPLTGSQRASGQQALRALRLAGGGASTPVVLRDTGSDPALAAQLFSSMARDPNVLAVIAPLASEELATLAPLADQLAVPLLLPPDYRGPTGRFAVRPSTGADDHVRALVEYAFGTLRLKRFGILYPNNANGHASMDLFQKEAVEEGATLVGIKGYSPGKSEFTAEIAAVLRWEAEGGLEAVFIPDGGPTLATLGSAIHVRAPKLLLLGLASWNDRPELMRAAAGLEGAIVASTDAGPPPAAMGLRGNASPIEAQVFDATMLGRRALERGPRSRPEMLAQLRQLSGGSGTDRLLRVREGRLERVAVAMTES